MFYKRIIELSEKKGKKLTTILKEIDVNTAYTGHWKKGVQPNTECLIKLSEYFNVSTDYLLCLTDNPEINK